MIWQFSGPLCFDNNFILCLTIILPTIALIFQLFWNAEYSLLTSAVIFTYATYICYASVTLNPREECNPTIGDSYQTVSKAVGFSITAVSISYATYSAVSVVLKDSERMATNATRTLQGISMLFILSTCYFAMVLTNWATMQNSEGVSNNKNAYTSMWFQASAQWIAVLLYIWCLVAPKLFPDRDFS